MKEGQETVLAMTETASIFSAFYFSLIHSLTHSPTVVFRHYDLYKSPDFKYLHILFCVKQW